MSLKELIQTDNSLFFNLDEFGETHNINGIEVDCILSMENGSAGLSNFAEYAVSTNNFELFIKADSIPFEFCSGDTVKIDKKTYNVESCTEEVGVYRIKLYQNTN